MRELNIERRVDFILLLSIVLFIAWYTYDAYSALASTENMIFIAPIAGVTLILSLLELYNQLKNKNKEEEEVKDKFKDIMPAIFIFAGYILSLEFLGFDIGTVIFIAIFLKVHGEKKWKNIVFYSLLFGILVPLFFSSMLPYPMPMSILPTDY